MTRDEIITLIKHKLGFRMNYDDAIIFAHLDLVQTTYEQVSRERPLPWFLFNATYTAATVADTRTIALPTDFLEFDDDWPLRITNADNEVKDLPRTTDYNIGETGQSSEGFPTCFTMDATTIRLYPLPDAAYTVTIPHYARSTKWSETESSDWFTEFPHLVIAETAYSVLASNRDIEGMQLIDLKMPRENYFTRVNAMQMVHKASVMNSYG